MIIRLRAYGIDRASLSLLRFQNRLMDVSPALEEVADYAMGAIDKNFASQGRRGGGSWKRLSPKWARRKERLGWDPRILHAKPGLPLRRSLTRRGDSHQRLRVYKDGRLILQSTLPYGRVHQDGDPYLGIPARPYMKFTRGDNLVMAKIVQRYLIGAIRS